MVWLGLAIGAVSFLIIGIFHPELTEQTRRVEKGWFPRNSNRGNKS